MKLLLVLCSLIAGVCALLYGRLDLGMYETNVDASLLSWMHALIQLCLSVFIVLGCYMAYEVAVAHCEQSADAAAARTSTEPGAVQSADVIQRSPEHSLTSEARS